MTQHIVNDVHYITPLLPISSPSNLVTAVVAVVGLADGDGQSSEDSPSPAASHLSALRPSSASEKSSSPGLILPHSGVLSIAVLFSQCVLIHVGSCLLDTTAVSISDLLSIPRNLGLCFCCSGPPVPQYLCVLLVVMISPLGLR